MIAIIDYGTANVQSVKNALDYLEVDAIITPSPKIIKNADKIILPGVGSFGFMMEQLNEKELVEPIKSIIKQGKPFLGICLGLQALFEESEESPGVKGIAIFEGKVKKFTKGKVPQIGWNNIKPQKPGLFKECYVYFVNSYYVVPEDESIVATKTDYYGKFVSAIKFENITATQFHPEKSGKAGIEILRRWLQC
jgi:imidazole glycerol phosphate synthase glutamine amidotransferase subunit